MTREDFLPPELEEVLSNMKFIEKYKSIWEKYAVENESYTISDDEIISVFDEFGYRLIKYNYQQYFSDFFLEQDFRYRLGISIKWNIVHFNIEVYSKKYNIKGGGGCGLLVQLMTNWEMPVQSPCFYDLNSFKSLSKDLINLFEEVKYNIRIYFKLE